MHKKGHKLKTSPLVKNPQFSSNLADTQAKLPTHHSGYEGGKNSE